MSKDSIKDLFDEIDKLPTEKVSLKEYLELNIKLIKLLKEYDESIKSE